MGTIWKKKKQRGRKKREKQLIGLTLTGLLMEGLGMASRLPVLRNDPDE
jgi:hypothetical protein